MRGGLAIVADVHMWGVLGEVLVVIGVHDGPSWVTISQIHGTRPTVDVVLGATVDGEVGRLMDERSRLGVTTSAPGVPEGTTEVDLSKLVGI